MVDLAILIIRVVAGVVMFAHSLPKLFWKRRVFDKKWRHDYGFPQGSVLLTGIIQAVGGLAMILGTFTQSAASILALNMLVATYVSIRIHREPFLSTPEGKGWDVNFLLIGALVVLIFLGDGSLSLAGLVA